LNPNESNLNPNESNLNPNESNLNPNESELNKKYTCEYCNGDFTTSSNYTRHIKNRCKVKKESNEEKELMYQELLVHMKELKEELKNIKNKPITSNTINTINNNTINNNIHNSINLVAYGKEDMSCITNQIYKKLFLSGSSSVVQLISDVHFNKHKPEHCNVYISNIRDKYVMIYDGEDWILKEQDNIITDLLETKKDYLIGKFEDLTEKLSSRTIKKFRRFLDREDDDAVVNSIKQEIKLLLYNQRKIPIEIRKSLENTDKITYIQSNA
jgi:hypothetical protein